MRDRPLALGLVVVLHLLIASPATAHKASAFAAMQGKVISGEAYFRDGAPLRGARVTIFDPAGTRLGETKTDSAGRFSFEPRRRCDHRFVVDAGDGHAAQYTVRAEEIPASLPEDDRATLGKGSEKQPAASRGETASGGAEKLLGSGDSHRQELRGQLEAIEAQIVQLRRDLAVREDRARWRDVLGGIGYLLGLMGLAFYFLGVRRVRTSRPGRIDP